MKDIILTEEGMPALERAGQVLAEMKKIKKNPTAANQPILNALQTELTELRTTKAYQDAMARPSCERFHV